MRFAGRAVAALMLTACGGAETTPSSGEIAVLTAQQVSACRAIAEKDCEAWQRCLPDTFATYFPDAAACIDDDALFWAAHFFGEDSGATLEGAAQCGLELDLSTCDAWWRLNYAAGPGACQRTGSTLCEAHRLWTYGDGPEACFPKGPRKPGDRCGSGSQCDSGICFFGQDPGLACGACQFAATEVGDSCSMDTATMCAAGLECQGATCGPLGGTYQPCSAETCLPHLICFMGTCHERNADGNPCDPHDYQGIGNCKPDRACNLVTNVCEARVPQPAEAECGALDGGVVGSCAAGTLCKLGKTVNEATCEPRLALGEACTSGYLFGDGCAFPGECVAGVCQLRGPSTCE